ncbi:hydroxyisourate hydrolase [Breoghania sp.]|uniref:hydroxyisourate hydrolase n=1 Tax=Breoghania sp. TaxID=2065378 RepID=UPI00260BAFE5|nr:hydroxyisourate hydrolase [Breoghania sp.]MDJ0929533.1 hydroxyisourate hydrolase [Breoghania sp.]
MGRLTTHVLDTAAGCPAAELYIELWCLDGDPTRLTTLSTNADGRADTPLLEGSSFRKGTYELRFFAGDYLRRSQTLPEPAFLDMIPIRFGISNSDQHYHVTLLLSAYGYSIYRGS